MLESRSGMHQPFRHLPNRIDCDELKPTVDSGMNAQKPSLRISRSRTSVHRNRHASVPSIPAVYQHAPPPPQKKKNNYEYIKSSITQHWFIKNKIIFYILYIILFLINKVVLDGILYIHI
jgi:hypothetical protein